jgi:hypothetical protein
MTCAVASIDIQGISDLPDGAGRNISSEERCMPDALLLFDRYSASQRTLGIFWLTIHSASGPRAPVSGQWSMPGPRPRTTLAVWRANGAVRRILFQLMGNLRPPPRTALAPLFDRSVSVPGSITRRETVVRLKMVQNDHRWGENCRSRGAIGRSCASHASQPPRYQ